MATSQPTSSQNLTQIKDTFNLPTATSSIITALTTESIQMDHQKNIDSDHEPQTKHEGGQGNKKKKNKKKKKNAVLIEAVPITVAVEQTQNSQNQLSQRQSKPQSTVVRHKITQIKKSLFTEGQPLNLQPNNSKQAEMNRPQEKGKQKKKEELNDKEMKAITSVLGQFFKVENLKNYIKIKQAIPEVKPSQPPARRIFKTVKPLIEIKTVEFPIDKPQKNEQIGLIQPLEVLSELREIKPQFELAHKLYTRIAESTSGNSSKKIQLQQISEPTPKNLPRSSYEQPQFQLIQPQSSSPLNQQLTNSPLVQCSADSISFDQEKPISPQSLEIFPNDNQFKHPLLECESRGSFPLEEMKPLSYEDDTNSIKNLKEVRSIEIIANKKLTNLKLNQNNASFCQSHEFNSQQMAHTPFFQIKQRDSDFELISYVKIRNIQQSANKKLQKTHSQSNPFHPKPHISFSHVSQIAKQTPIETHNQNSKVSLMSQIYPKRLNSFMPMDEQMNHIERIFKDFNRQNKMMIDVLSYNASFETVEEVSNNLVNEMEKDQEDAYVNQLLTKNQQEWRRKLLGPNAQLLTPSKQLNLTPSKQLNLSITKTPSYLIRRPSPTKTCSPSKYIYMSKNITQKYEKNHQQQNQSGPITNQNQPCTISNKSPLRLPTFSHNFPTHPQTDSEINDDSSSKRQESMNFELDEFSYRNDTINDKRIMLPLQNDNFDAQKSQLRDFYDYLQSKESSYQPRPNQHESSFNHSLSARNFDLLSNRHQRTASNQQKVIPTFQNLHQIKQTSKPLIAHNTQIDLNNLSSSNSIMENNDKVLPFISSKVPQNLETLAMTFKKKNPVGGHTNLIEDTISLVGSVAYQQNDLGNPSNSKIQSKKIIVPIHTIQPIRVTSKSKSKYKNKKQTISKGQNISTVPVKKLIVVSANPVTPAQRTIQMPKIFKPPQMTGFLMTPSHLGAMMLSNSMKSYLVPQTPQAKEFLPQQPKQKAPQTIQTNPKEPGSTKKKIQINSKQGSNSKKISINQKTNTNQKQQTGKTEKTSYESVESTTRQLFSKLNPQLQQTISRINQKPQKQLHNLIKSRITERSHSKESSRYQISGYKKPKVQSRMIQNESFHSNYQPEPTQLKQAKATLKDYSASKEKQYRHSRNSSRSSKKSGLELWNEGLSSLKQSRKQNGSKSPKIFRQKSHRQNQKVIGVTRWNENLSKLKQSRSKSRQSGYSNGKSQTFAQSNRKENLNQSTGFNTGRPQTTMNVEIKKHKYQVNNVQKRYL